MPQPPQVDLFDPAFKANPYPTYAQWRSSAPIHRITLPDGRGVWLVTRHEDVLAIFKDKRFVKDWRKVLTPEQLAQIPPIPQVMEPLEQEHARHGSTRSRTPQSPQSPAFTPRLIERMRGRIQAIADSLLDAVEDKGEMDLIDEYAFPLPIMVIAEFLGVPAEDRNSFREWSDAAVSGNATTEYLEEVLVPHMTAFSDYLEADVRREAHEP